MRFVGEIVVIDYNLPYLVKDIIVAYNRNDRKNYQIGQCPLCGYAVENTLDEFNCHWCGQTIKWYNLNGDKK